MSIAKRILAFLLICSLATSAYAQDIDSMEEEYYETVEEVVDGVATPTDTIFKKDCKWNAGSSSCESDEGDCYRICLCKKNKWKWKETTPKCSTNDKHSDCDGDDKKIGESCGDSSPSPTATATPTQSPYEMPTGGY